MIKNDEDIYIIPHNYTDNGKIFGVIEKQSLYTAAAWFVPMTFLILKAPRIPIDIGLFIEIIVICPITLILLVGIGGDTVIDFLANLLDFYDNAKIYEKSEQGYTRLKD